MYILVVHEFFRITICDEDLQWTIVVSVLD